MKVNNKEYQTVWMEGGTVMLIEQNLLPFDFQIFESKTREQTCMAIKTMIVRGAGAIGATAAFAMVQGFIEAGGNAEKAMQARRAIEATRPTAQNLFYATGRVYAAAANAPDPVAAARAEAEEVWHEDMECSRSIGQYGAGLIQEGDGILTHCNAGWLAFVDFGTALSPIYTAHRQGKGLFVYADETRPRSQGARLTAWELKNENVPHAIIPDNAAAHYMSLGKIQCVIVGADRIAANGDTANKIGTLEKALAANYYKIPFYVAAPTSTIDMQCPDGRHIPIEERSADEVLWQTGLGKDGQKHTVLTCSPGSNALNPAFDVTPAPLITGIITQKGIIKADKEDVARLFG